MSAANPTQENGTALTQVNEEKRKEIREIYEHVCSVFTKDSARANSFPSENSDFMN